VGAHQVPEHGQFPLEGACSWPGRTVLAATAHRRSCTGAAPITTGLVTITGHPMPTFRLGVESLMSRSCRDQTGENCP